MSEKAKEILEKIAESADCLDDKGKAFLEGYLARAVHEKEAKPSEKKED